jgi:hypothetical protein
MLHKRTKARADSAPDRGLVYLALAFALAAALAVVLPSPSHLLF